MLLRGRLTALKWSPDAPLSLTFLFLGTRHGRRGLSMSFGRCESFETSEVTINQLSKQTVSGARRPKLQIHKPEGEEQQRHKCHSSEEELEGRNDDATRLEWQADCFPHFPASPNRSRQRVYQRRRRASPPEYVSGQTRERGWKYTYRVVLELRSSSNQFEHLVWRHGGRDLQLLIMNNQTTLKSLAQLDEVLLRLVGGGGTMLLLNPRE